MGIALAIAVVIVLLYGFLVAPLLRGTRAGQGEGGMFPELRALGTGALSFQELSDFFKQLAEEKSARYAFQALAAASVPPGTDMHLLAHVVGDVLYRKEGMQGIRICTNEFRNACSHSIVVGVLLERGETALEDIARICRDAPGGSGAYTMCFHGLGHGVLAYTGYDFEAAVGLCQRTATAAYRNREAVECIGGGMMEMVSGIHNPGLWRKQRERYFKEDDPLYPCTADFMPRDERDMCYLYITPHLFTTAGANLSSPGTRNFSKAFTFCNAVSLDAGANRDACYGGFGKEFVVLAQGRDIRKIEELTTEQLQRVYDWCMLADASDGRMSCMRHVVNSLYWGGENRPNAAIRFCALIPDASTGSACFQHLTGAVGYFVRDTRYREAYCDELPSQIQEECRVSLRVPKSSR